MKSRILLAAALLAAPALAAGTTAKPAQSPSEIIAAAPAEAWVAIPSEDLLVMDLAPGGDGAARRVVIQLVAAPFSRPWVANIRALAKAHWWDGLAIVRAQDNYVVQWGDPEGEDATKAKPLPPGLLTTSESDYTVDGDAMSDANSVPATEFGATPIDPAAEAAAAEVERVFRDPKSTEADHEAAIGKLLAATGLGSLDEMDDGEKRAMISIASTATANAPEGWHERDSYAEWVEIWHGWPIANRDEDRWVNEDGAEVPNPKVPRHEARALGVYREVDDSKFWPVHCYGTVGVGRGLSPDAGTGAELYTVIGHAPRHLDRNIAVVGRVIEGIEHLSTLPRGTEALGFYATPAERTPIAAIRLASELPAAEQPRFEFLSTESLAFADYTNARANRQDEFFIAPAGGADVCNIPVPVRRKP